MIKRWPPSCHHNTPHKINNLSTSHAQPLKLKVTLLSL